LYRSHCRFRTAITRPRTEAESLAGAGARSSLILPALQYQRRRVEQSFGWMKMVGMIRKVKLRGIDKVGWLFSFTGAAYHLCRLRNLMAQA
jgi:hypothetical protein